MSPGSIGLPKMLSGMPITCEPRRTENISMSTGAPVYRYFGMNSGPFGNMSFGPGLINYANTHLPPLGHVAPGSSFHFQGWFRDPFGPCGTGKNLTNAMRINFLP